MNTIIPVPVSSLILIAGLACFFLGAFIMCLIHSAVLRAEIFELQDRLAELISWEDDDDDDEDPELRPLVPMDPNARVPRNITPHA